MKLKAFLISILIAQVGFTQIPVRANFFYAKEWSKAIALYRAKSFVVKNILGVSNETVKFEIDPLAASNSGELTTLVYKCETKDREGLVLGFFGDYWNDAGVVYTGYAFKDLPKIKALELLDKIEKVISDNYKYIDKDRDNNNIYLQDGDLTFLIYNIGINSTKIRIFWDGFDAEWDANALFKTEKMFQKKLK